MTAITTLPIALLYVIVMLCIIIFCLRYTSYRQNKSIEHWKHKYFVVFEDRVYYKWLITVYKAGGDPDKINPYNNLRAFTIPSELNEEEKDHE